MPGVFFCLSLDVFFDFSLVMDVSAVHESFSLSRFHSGISDHWMFSPL